MNDFERSKILNMIFFTLEDAILILSFIEICSLHVRCYSYGILIILINCQMKKTKRQQTLYGIL